VGGRLEDGKMPQASKINLVDAAAADDVICLRKNTQIFPNKNVSERLIVLLTSIRTMKVEISLKKRTSWQYIFIQHFDKLLITRSSFREINKRRSSICGLAHEEMLC
jgi:hypothetical protein